MSPVIVFSIVVLCFFSWCCTWYKAQGSRERQYIMLVKKLVAKFKDQRKISNSEFAVLVLSPEEISTIEKTICWSRNGALTNRMLSTYPPDNDLGNFMVARPDGLHAEVLLMHRFNSLWARQSRHCKTILLYSWLLPCISCAQTMADVLGPFAGGRRIIVLYTYSAKEQEQQERESKLIFSRRNIMMVKVKYYKRLLSPDS